MSFVSLPTLHFLRIHFPLRTHFLSQRSGHISPGCRERKLAKLSKSPPLLTLMLSLDWLKLVNCNIHHKGEYTSRLNHETSVKLEQPLWFVVPCRLLHLAQNISNGDKVGLAKTSDYRQYSEVILGILFSSTRVNRHMSRWEKRSPHVCAQGCDLLLQSALCELHKCQKSELSSARGWWHAEEPARGVWSSESYLSDEFWRYARSKWGNSKRVRTSRRSTPFFTPSKQRTVVFTEEALEFQ